MTKSSELFFNTNCNLHLPLNFITNYLEFCVPYLSPILWFQLKPEYGTLSSSHWLEFDSSPCERNPVFSHPVISYFLYLSVWHTRGTICSRWPIFGDEILKIKFPIHHQKNWSNFLSWNKTYRTKKKIHVHFKMRNLVTW